MTVATVILSMLVAMICLLIIVLITERRSLAEIEKNLRSLAAKLEEQAERERLRTPEMPASVPETSTAGTAEQEPASGTTDILSGIVSDTPEKVAGGEKESPAASEYNKGKSGKVYTEEELELLIKE